MLFGSLVFAQAYSVAMDFVVLFPGVLLVGLVVLQLTTSILGDFQRIRNQTSQRKLKEELIRQRIRAVQNLQNEQSTPGGEGGTVPAWNGYRKMVVDRKKFEAEGICSFYLKPHDGKPLPPFRPGQFLTFRVNLPGQDKPTIRCYSLSDAPHPEYYRVTIKRVGRERPESCSNYFHDHIEAGDILDVRAPSGKFVLDPEKKKPAVLIAGGVGLTPMLSMLNCVVGASSQRQVHLFYGVRCGREHVQKEWLENLAANHDNVHLTVCYSQPESGHDRQGDQFQRTGHIDIALLQEHLSTSNYEFYMCGPPPMMKTLMRQLTNWGVPKSDIFTEAFASPTAKALQSAKPSSEQQAPPCKVTFARSGKALTWGKGLANLLEAAENEGVTISSGCRAGSCGECEVAVKLGEVVYATPPEFQAKDGCCLTCVGAPKGDVVLDA